MLMDLKVDGGESAVGCGSVVHPGWLFSLCLMLGIGLPITSSHGGSRSTRIRPKAQTHLKHLLMSYLLTFHWPEQVA